MYRLIVGDSVSDFSSSDPFIFRKLPQHTSLGFSFSNLPKASYLSFKNSEDGNMFTLFLRFPRSISCVRNRQTFLISIWCSSFQIDVSVAFTPKSLLLLFCADISYKCGILLLTLRCRPNLLYSENPRPFMCSKF